MGEACFTAGKKKSSDSSELDWTAFQVLTETYWGSGFGVQGLGSGICSLGFGACGSGFYSRRVFLRTRIPAQNIGAVGPNF